MENKAKTAFEHIRGNSGAKQLLAEYLRGRLLEKQKALLSCNRDTFEVAKGRCLELKELLDDLLK